jgi:hypothetical protein
MKLNQGGFFMLKATRELIKARQLHTKFVVEKVDVKLIGGGEQNDCFNNAYNFKETNKGAKVVSGWMVNKFDIKTNSTAIIQHFWNVDAFGTHVDTTPLVGNEHEYVIDVDILIFGQKHYDELDTLVSSSLLLRNGFFSTVEISEDDIEISLIPALKTEYFFRTQMV